MTKDETEWARAAIAALLERVARAIERDALDVVARLRGVR